MKRAAVAALCLPCARRGHAAASPVRSFDFTPTRCEGAVQAARPAWYVTPSRHGSFTTPTCGPAELVFKTARQSQAVVCGTPGGADVRLLRSPHGPVGSTPRRCSRAVANRRQDRPSRAPRALGSSTAATGSTPTTLSGRYTRRGRPHVLLRRLGEGATRLSHRRQRGPTLRRLRSRRTRPTQATARTASGTTSPTTITQGLHQRGAVRRRARRGPGDLKRG